MSTATILPLTAAGHECPTWCARDSRAEATGSHIGHPIRLAVPEAICANADSPMVSVQIVQGHDEEARGEPPRLWLTAAGDVAELDGPGLAALIADLEQCALQLRGLKHRFDTVLVGGAPETVDHYPDPTHPLELVAPCPPWCVYRDDEEHTPTGLLVDYFHSSGEDCMELTVAQQGGTQSPTLEPVLSHSGYDP